MKSKEKQISKKQKLSLKKKITLKSTAIFFGATWILTILIFLAFLVVGTNFFQTTVDKDLFKMISG